MDQYTTVAAQKKGLEDHFYRHVERTLDLSFVREFVQETYAGGGRMVEFFGMWVPVRQSHLGKVQMNLTVPH